MINDIVKQLLFVRHSQKKIVGIRIEDYTNHKVHYFQETDLQVYSRTLIAHEIYKQLEIVTLERPITFINTRTALITTQSTNTVFSL